MRNLYLNEKQFRLLGFLPLMFFLAQAIHYWHIGEQGHILWMCNIGNLVMALGIFLDLKPLVRVTVIWTIPGLIVWMLYVVPTWSLLLTRPFSFGAWFGVISSSLAHLGGIAVGLIALKGVRMDNRTWMFSFGWYLIMHVLSRLLTSPAMNVNLSHRIQDGWEQSFSSYWKFWIVLSCFVLLCSWLLNFTFKRIWPVEGIDARTAGSVNG